MRSAERSSRRVRVRTGWVVATSLSLATMATACGAQVASDLVVSSDPRLASVAAELLPDLARRSGMELREPVRVERRTRDDLVRYLEYKLDQELPVEEARDIVDAYALFGLVPPDLDLRAVLMGLYTEQVAGFYEPDSTALFVLDDQPETELRGLLIHELVHAVQDQSADLVALTDTDRGSDRATAAQAAIEGHATLVMFEYLAEQQTGSPVDLSKVPGFGAMLRQNLAGIRAQFPVLASAPRVVQETLIFPYLEGAVYLQERWSGGERVVPFGDELPLSTEEILRGEAAGRPVDVELAVRGGDVVRSDALGRLELGVLLEEHTGAAHDAIADAWAGDAYVLVDRNDGDRMLVSYVLWDDEATRDRFVELMSDAIDRFGGVASVEATEAGGWPASMIVVGPRDGVEVRVVRAELN